MNIKVNILNLEIQSGFYDLNKLSCQFYLGNNLLDVLICTKFGLKTDVIVNNVKHTDRLDLKFIDIQDNLKQQNISNVTFSIQDVINNLLKNSSDQRFIYQYLY